MWLVRWFPVVALSASVLVAACGDGPDETPATPATTAEANGDAFGPAPDLRDNVTDVIPAHASTVTRAELLPPGPNRPGGICFDANFEGFESGNLQWFRLAVNGAGRTTEITWFPRNENREALGCYVPGEPLDAGVHQVAVSVQNPNNPSEPPRQLVSWKFEVTD